MATIRKSAWILAFAALMLIGIAASNRQALAATSDQAAAKSVDIPAQYYYYNFEQGTKPWAPVYNGSQKVGGLSLRQIKGVNGCPSLHDDAYANLKMSLSSPVPLKPSLVSPLPVGTWMLAAVPASGLSNVRVDYSAANTGGCLGCNPMVYVGAKPPTGATQFAVDSLPLKTTWQQFSYDTTVQTGNQVYVAIGFNNTDATMGIDCVGITVDPLLTDKITPQPIRKAYPSTGGTHTTKATPTPVPAR